MAVALVIAGALLVAQREQLPAGRFQAGTNIIRVDATVLDRNGSPVPSLTADDFELREDGVLQTISSFRFLVADGRPSDDRSLPIRSQAHAVAEAGRDDVRTFLIFWDAYGITPPVGERWARDGLTRAVLATFGETDLVALMDPLTPLAAIEFTRDRRAMVAQIRALEGRRGVYSPPRNAVEATHLRAAGDNMRDVDTLRNTVTISAVKAAATHLGMLEGRKTLLVISEGFGPVRPGVALGRASAAGDLIDTADAALDLVRTANDSNVAIHVVNPAGLETRRRPTSFLEAITRETGGELHQANDLTVPFKKAVTAASAHYLLGYAREMPTDGRFHRIKVEVKRRGLEVRARAGYWAITAAESERARMASNAADVPSDVAAALASLANPVPPRPADSAGPPELTSRDAAPFTTPVLYRAATGAQARTMQDAVPAVPAYAGHDFVSTDRLFVRLSSAAAGSAVAAPTARLLDRRGRTLVTLPMAVVTAADTWQIDLPVGSLASGEYVIAVEAVGASARALVPFRVR